MAEDFQAFAHKAVHLKSAEAQLRAERIEIVKGKLKLQSQRDKALMGGNAAAVPNTDDSFCVTPSARNLDGRSTSQVEPETTRIDDRKDDIDTFLLRRAPSSLGQARYNLNSSFDVVPKDLNFRCQKTKPIHPSFPTVIYLDNNWTEIACGHCGANASYRQNELKLYGGGFVGLYNHFRAAHKDETDVSAGAMVKTCTRRVVSDEDAELMKEGKEPVVKIKPIIGERKKAPSHAGPDLLQTHAGVLHSNSEQPSLERKLLSTATSPSFHAIQSSNGRSTSSAATLTSNDLRHHPSKSLTKYEEWQQPEAEAKKGGAQALKQRKSAQMAEKSTKRAFDYNEDDDDDDDDYRPFKRIRH